MATSPPPDLAHGDDETSQSHTQNPNPQNDQNPQPPETLTLEEDATPQNQDDPDGFDASPPPDRIAAAVNSSVYRRGSKRKKGVQKRVSAVQERKRLMKLETLLQNIKPIPFVPAKTLDFAAHEKLLHRLGLWNFVHLEFDSDLRVHLIAQLVANFNPAQRGSYVNGVKIRLNRTDLARALKLPPPGKKDKSAVGDVAAEVGELGQSIAFVDDLVSNYMLLHEDMWMMPEEVLKSVNLIKEGSLEKVEWATLIWFMVEKELMLAPNLENCYYASHLQCLIKWQRGDLFEFKPRVEIDLKDDEEEKPRVEIDLKDDEEEKPRVEIDLKDDEEEKPRVEIDLKDDEDEKPKVESSLKEIEEERPRMEIGLEEIEEEEPRVEIGLEEIEEEKPRVEISLKEDEEEKPSVEISLKEDEEEKPSMEMGLKEDEGEKPGLGVDLKEDEEEERDGSNDVRMGDAVNDFQVSEAEGSTDVKMGYDVDDFKVSELDAGADVKMCDDVNGVQVSEMEEHKIELSLGGQDSVDGIKECVEGVDDHGEKAYGEAECDLGADDNVEKSDGEKECAMGMDAMDFEECKGEELGQWFLDGKSNADEHYMRRCNLSGIRDSGFMEEKHEGIEEEQQQEEDEEEEQQDGGFHLSPNALSSDNLIQALEAAQNPFGSELQLHDHSPGDFLSSRGESHMISGGPSLFGNAHKREYGNENVISHGGLNGANKRLRSDDSFDDKSCDFYACMDQMQHLLRKARMVYETKDHSLAESSMNQQVLLNELHQRDNTINSMHSQRIAEQQKREVETYRLERELFLMGNLLQNYKKALKETQRSFAEYRARFPQPHEPLYKDVPGSGGLVLSTNELEKLRLKQLEEIRLNQMVFEKKLNDFEDEWTTKMNGYLDRVHLLGSKLLGFEKEVEHLKELSAERMVSKLPEAKEDAPEEC